MIPRRARHAALLALLALALAAPPASANGRFPRAQDYVQSIASPNLRVLRTTFGLVLSTDGGARWEFWCEDAFAYTDGYDPPLAFAADGTLLVALDDGLVATQDGCAVRRQQDLEGLAVKDLAASADGRTVWAAVTTHDAAPSSRVARSTDNGRTFTFPGDAMEGLVLDTVETAASDALRLYASGSRLADGTPVVLRSDDGGAHWRPAGASFGGAHGVYVSAVDPSHADVVWLRVEGAAMDASTSAASALFRSDDAGATARLVWQARGPMRGVALSPDGRTVWAGGPEDGVWTSRDGATMSQLGTDPVECLRYAGGALWACRTFVPGGALLLRGDGAGPFATALSVADIGGPPSRCVAGTAMHDLCPGRWNGVLRTLLPADGRDASAPADARPTAPPATPGGCGCATRTGSVDGAPVAFLALMAVSRRRRRR